MGTHSDDSFVNCQVCGALGNRAYFSLEKRFLGDEVCAGCASWDRGIEEMVLASVRVKRIVLNAEQRRFS